MSYIGNEPVISATRTITEIVATAGQTTFTANGGYTVGYVDVFVNGAQLQLTDFTATNGSTIVLNQAATVNDDVRIVAWGTFNTNSVQGNLALTGTAARITGDFSNATVANRVFAQTSTTNSVTSFGVIPNGTGSNSSFVAFNNSDPTNASFAGLNIVGSTDVRLQAGITGTGTSLPLTMYTGGSERLRIDTSGNVGIGTSSPVTKLHLQDNSAVFIQMTDVGDGSSRIGQNGTALTFGVDGVNGATERMRITSAGEVFVGNTAASYSVKGFYWAHGTGEFIITNTLSSGGSPLELSRNASDGDLVRFYQAGTQEGSISVSGTTVSYNGGHLARWAQLSSNQKDDTLLKGTVMSNLDDMCVWEKDGVVADNEQLNKMKVSDVEGDTNVAGVFVNWTRDENFNSDDMNVAMTGDMIIRIAEGVVIQKGDLLMSAGDGTAKPQDDDIVRSKTIAKVTSNHVTCTYEDGSYCVPCVLMAC
jgi:hypothetical protein